jgi:hypothetical protein
MEILLALAVLVALGAIAWPALRGPLAQARLRAGAQRFQSACGEGRLLAMGSGEVYVMQYTIGGNEYRLEPLSGGDPTLMSEDSLLDPTLAVLNSKQWTLPPDVTFVNQEVIADDRNETAAMMMQQRQTSTSAVPPSQIFFYPDGQSSTARVTMANLNERQIAVELRGLTGTARVLEEEVVQ